MLEYSLFWVKPDVFYDRDMEREAWSELKLALPSPEIFISDIRRELVERSLKIIDIKTYLVSENTAKAHYQEHVGVYDNNYNEYKQDFLIKYLTSWISSWIIFSWEDAILKWREVLRLIRELYLETPKLARYNMTHASDNPEWAIEEINLHFPDFKI